MAMPRPEELNGPAARVHLARVAQEWRNYWLAVQRTQSDLPDEVRRSALERPAEFDEALAEVRAVLAVTVHPDIIATFVKVLDAMAAELDSEAMPRLYADRGDVVAGDGGPSRRRPR